MRILYVTTVGCTMVFFKTLIKELLDAENTVDIATNCATFKVPECYYEWGCKVYQISTSRSPINLGNIIAINEIKNLAKDYDIVHCHTPLASMATRIACKNLRKNGLKVIYTAHGFHFYKGGPLINWLIYYPIEWLCAHWTDVIITINKEDYTLAKRKMRANIVEYIQGVGIDVTRFSNIAVDRNKKRTEIGVPEDAFLILSVGELNTNKNHQIILRAMAQIYDKNIHYAIAGKGDQKSDLLKLARELGIENRVHLLGYRIDVAELYKTADIYALPSIREGLNVSVMEAMASGLPCIVSNIRGNRDMIDEKGGALFSPTNVLKLKDIIARFTCQGRMNCGNFNSLKAKKFDINIINKQMMAVYYK